MQYCAHDGQFMEICLTGWPSWLIIAVLAYCFARYTHWACIPISLLLIVAFVYFRDCYWMHLEMTRPDWNGQPDMDGIWAIGEFIRIVFVMLAVTPLILIGIWLRRRKRKLSEFQRLMNT